jgi:hypothetical protein
MQRFAAATVLLCFAFTASAFAQVNSAIGGTVQDSSQALIPGVEITATNTQTGVVATTITNESGAYNFAALIPGIYRVRAALSGFRAQTYNEVQLSASIPIRLNFTLEVGTVTQSVEVTVAADTILKESSASVGEVLTETRVSALPVVGNNVLDLVRILPGYRESTGGNFLDTFAGAPASTLNTVRDGISVSDGRFNNGLFATTAINTDLVGEVRLILTPVDAEMGRGNAQVQITNRFAGSAVWNARNTALDPNTWANNRQIDPTTGKAPLRDWTNDHEYTISYGGPIVHNKTFFYTLWDQRIRKERQTVNGIVLTDPARLGIFRFYDGWNPGNADAVETLLSVAASSPTRIARAVDLLGNPTSPRFNANGTPYNGLGLQCLSVFGSQRLDSKGNMVPFTSADCQGGTAIFPAGGATTWDANRPVIDPSGHVFAAAIKDMPHANWFGANGTTDGLNTASIRWLRTAKSAGDTFGTSPNDNRKQFNIKIDHHFNTTHKISGSYTLERDTSAVTLSNWPNGISGDGIRNPHVISTNLTSTLGPTLVNEARFGFRGNYNKVRRPFETEEGAKLLEFVNSIKGGPDPGYTRNVGGVYPLQIEPTGGGNYGFGQANAIYNRLAQHNGNTTRQFTYGDTVSWTKGEHAFKFGVEFRPQDSKGYTNLGTNPYPRLSTGAGAVPSPLRQGGASNLGAGALTSVRNNMASLAYLLSGSVNLVTQAYWIDSFTDIKDAKWQSIVTSPDVFRTIKTNELSAFVKDDWKITRNLTLNLGVRWEYYGAAYIAEGFTTTPRDRGLGVFGVSRGASRDVFDSWLVAGANPVFLSGYGQNAPNSTALQCTQGVVQANLPTSSCNAANLTDLEFVGPGSPHPERTASPADWNNFGPAVGFSYQVPEFVPGLGRRSTIRGGYSITYSPTRNLSTVQAGAQDMFGSAPGSTSALSTAADLSAQVPGYLDLRDIARIVPLKPISPNVPGGTLPIYATAGTRVYGFASDYTTPYVENFNLSLTTSLRRNMAVDIRYVGTQAKKQTGDINLNLNNVYYNKEFYDALDSARRGGNPLLLDQMFAGLTLGNGATTAVGNRNSSGVVVTGAAALRAATTYNADLRDGNYLAIAAALQSPVTPTGYVSGRPNGTTPTRMLIRNGCDRIATLGSPNYVSPTGDITPLRCFPENYLIANPQLQTATATTGAYYRTNSGFTNYHSMEAQFTFRPTHGFSAQSTYTWSKTLGVFGDGNVNPLNRRVDYTRPYSSLTHDLRTNGTIELPMGPNKLLFGDSSGWLARALERWQTGIILNLGSGRPTSISALTGLTYAAGGLTAPNTVADVVGPWDRRTGGVKWDGPNNRGAFFGDSNPFVSVPDPQCALSQGWVTTQVNAGGANVDCSLRAIARQVSPGTAGAVTLSDGRTIQYLLVNPIPGKQGNLGQTTVEGPGTIRFDATNVLNHPNPPDPIFSINDENFGYLTGDKTGNRSFQGQLRLSF